MSPELEESAFRRLLEVEAARERTLVQRLARPEAVAAQALSLAQTQWERGLRELPGAIAARDFDEPYLNIYRSIISGCKGLLAAYGYRIQGGDGAHFETLRLATMELVAWNREAGTLLESIREPIRSARNEAEYQRPGVTTEAELRQLFAAAAEILADFVSEVDRLIGPLSLPGSTRGTSRTSEEWRVPCLENLYHHRLLALLRSRQDKQRLTQANRRRTASHLLSGFSCSRPSIGVCSPHGARRRAKS